MKIVFEGSELKEGIIKVSLDGGFTFKDYEIANVKESGVPLDDSQRYDKIKIKGPANILKSLDVVSNVKVEGEQSSESSDYDTRIEWYSWKSDDGKIIFTKTDDKTQDCIIYEKRPVDEEGNYDYVEFPSASRIAFRWTDDGIVKSWAGGPGIQTYLYSRFPIGDVKEPKKTNFYSWRIVKGRLLQTDGVLVNPGLPVGTLYTTKNPEIDHAPYVFYKKGTDNNMSIEFIHNEEISRELEGTQFAGDFAVFTGLDGDFCEIMFNGSESAEKLGVEMASVPVEAINTTLSSTENYTSSVEIYDWDVYDGKVTESDGSVIEEGTFVERVFTLSEPHIGERLDFYRVDDSGNISFCFSRLTYQMFPDAQAEFLRKQIGAGNAEYTSNHQLRSIYFTTKPTPKSFEDWCM